MSSRQRRPAITQAARQDIIDIVTWTKERFGAEQARRYRERIAQAVERLEDEPIAIRSLESVGRPDLFMFRVGGRSRHLLVLQRYPSGRWQVLRVLHEAMDLGRHLPPE